MKYPQGGKINWIIILSGLLFVGFLVFLLRNDAFAPSDNPSQLSSKLRVVVTFFPLYDFVNRVAGDKADLDILFAQTPEAASFSPRELQKINRADLIIKNGAGLEPVLDELIAAGDNKNIEVIDSSRGIELLGAFQEIGTGEGEGSEKHTGSDPHIWLDPQNAIIQAQNIRDALAVRDPENADLYKNNAEQLIRELKELDQELQGEIAKLPRKDFIAFHPSFQYFAKRYGLKQAAVIEEFPGKEPSPRYISEIIKIIKERKVRVIFSEPQFSPRIVEVLARDLGLTVHTLDPIETGDPQKDSYISRMRNNLETLKAALQ